MSESGSVTLMERVAAPANADPIGLGAFLMALVTGTTVVILAFLYGRKIGVRRLLGVLTAVLGLALTTMLFVFTVRTAQAFDIKDVGVSEAMAFNSENGTWTLVREVHPRTWSILTCFSLSALYFYCILVVFVTPASERIALSKRNSAPVSDENPTPSNSSSTREQSHRCDFNRVWVNFLSLVIGVAIVGAFGGAVASTRQAVPVGGNVPSAVLNETTKARPPAETEPLQECICKYTECVGEPNLLSCRYVLSLEPRRQEHVWECLTNLKNTTQTQRKSIANSIDRCVKRESVTTGSTIGLLVTSCFGSLLLGVFTFSGRPLIYTASFLLAAYFAICTVLFSTLPLLFAYLDGPVNATYGVSGDVVYLSVVAGPAGVRMARLSLICLFAQLVVMIVAAATEIGTYSWYHTFYDLFAIKPNNDELDADAYYGYTLDSEG